MENNAITIETTVNAPVSKVWEYWNNPEHIKQWAFAADTWHAPHAENNLQVGGKFTTTMAAKDGSISFDFCPPLVCSFMSGNRITLVN